MQGGDNVSKTEVTQRSDFECAYLVDTTEHFPVMSAHHYRIEATVTGVSDNGIIIEFSNFKHLIDSVLPNNCFIYNNTLVIGPEWELAKCMKKLNINPIGYPFMISAENLVNHLAASIQTQLDKLHPGVILENVKLRETNNSYTSWSRNI